MYSASALPNPVPASAAGRRVAMGSILFAILLGLLSVAAFAPLSYSALWLLVFAGLAWLWQRAVTARRAFVLGYGFGLAQFGLGVSWVQISMHRFGGASLFESIALTFLFIAFLALYPALVALVYVWLRRVVAFSLLPILFAGLWWGGEALRSTLFSGFPWLLAGVAQVDGLWNPWLGWIGAPASGALLALVGAASGLLFCRPETRSRHGLFARNARHQSPLLWVFGPALLVMSASAGQMVEKSPHKGVEVGESSNIKVRLLQYGVVQDQKWRDSQRAATLDWYREQTARPGADLVLWPETAVPAFASNVSDYFHEIEDIAGKNQSAVVLGVVRDEALGYHNALFGFGRAQGSYDKRHLVPFGEYLPLKSIFSPIMDMLKIPMADFAPGIDGQDGIRFDGIEVGSTICYEVAYPKLVESGRAGFLITVSNDAWFGGSWAADQHLQIARARAAEHGLPMLRATNSGITAVIGAQGEVLARLPRGVPGALEWDLIVRRDQEDAVLSRVEQ